MANDRFRKGYGERDLNRRHIRWALHVMDEMERGNKAVRAAVASENERRAALGKERRRAARKGKPRMLVQDDEGRTFIVRAGSCFDAIVAVEDEYGVDWMGLRNARVTLLRDDTDGERAV